MGATMVWKFGIIVTISLVGKLSAVQKCLNVFTDKHLEYLDEMIAGQLESTCTIRKDLIIKGHLTDYCYNKIRLHQLWNLLGSLTFKNGSLSHKHTELLKDLYKNEMTGCINSDDIKEEHIMACSETTDLSPTGILETVRGSFLIYQKFQPDSESDEECEVLYNKCNKVDDYPTTKEKHGDDKTEEHRKSNLFIIFIIILSILGLLWLCGLLYYRYHYRLLQRRLHRDCDLQLPEESPLQLQITEIV